MRISIPSIPHFDNPRPVVEYTLEQGSELLASFLQRGRGRNLLLSGAGISVDSGIAPYRGPNGHYTAHKNFRPIFFHEFTSPKAKGHYYRQRYWSRSFLGYPAVMHATPNPGHYSTAALQRLGHVPAYITQNVDGLHHAATPSRSLAASSILELHGTLQHVVCVSRNQEWKEGEIHNPSLLSRMAYPPGEVLPSDSWSPAGKDYVGGCGFRGPRAELQHVLEEWNPPWAALAEEMRTTRRAPKTNPDGDVELASGTNYSTFEYPRCPSCGGVLKPSVVYFGESVPDRLKSMSLSLVEEASQVLVVGSSLATYSAFRLVKMAHEQGKPILVLNQGPTRGDPLIDDKVELGSSQVLQRAAQHLAGSRAEGDAVLQRLLTTGEINKPIPRVVGS